MTMVLEFSLLMMELGCWEQRKTARLPPSWRYIFLDIISVEFIGILFIQNLVCRFLQVVVVLVLQVQTQE